MIAITLLIALPACAQSFDNWLVLAIDVSGSVTNEEYALQRDGYADVLLDYKVATALDRTGVAIIEFGTITTVAVDWTDVRTAGALYRVRKRPFSGSTCVACAISRALDLLKDKTGKRVIDISGDGVENVRCRDNSIVELRERAKYEGVQINTLAILVQPDTTGCGGGLELRPHWEGATALERWYMSLATGFSIAINSLDDLRYALYRKLFAEIAGIDVPDHEIVIAITD